MSLSTYMDGIAFLLAGGPVVLVLIIMSVFIVTLVFIKLFQFVRLGLVGSKANQLARQFLSSWRTSNYDEARRIIADNKHPQLKLLQHSSQLIADKRLHGKALADEMKRYGLSQLSSLRTNLRPIEVVAALAPLIGLLGTVMGMIEAFQAMEEAGKQVDPSVLSGGIWQALLTTAVGLIVAVPATFFYNWFDRKVELCGERMRDNLGELMTIEAESQTVSNGSSLRQHETLL